MYLIYFLYRDHDILSNKLDNHNDNYHINNNDYYGDNIIV